jgi:ADP-heptose:LPS heptosyltransferase
MYEKVRSWTNDTEGEPSEVLLGRLVSRDDYPEELWSAWESDPDYRKISPENICVYVEGLKLGDAILIMPMLKSIRTAFPNSRIIIIGPGLKVTSGLDILKNENVFDVFWESNITKYRPWFYHQFKKWAGIIDKYGKIDLLIDAQRRFLVSLFLKTILKPEKFLSFCAKGILSDWIVPEPDRKKRHETCQALSLSRRLGIPVPQPLHDMKINTKFKNISSGYLDNIRAGRFVSLFPFTFNKNDPKTWPYESYLSLARQITASGSSVILIGSLGEQKELRAMADDMGKGVFCPDYAEFSLNGKDALFFNMALLRNAGLAIAADSGGAHLAAALGTPTLVLAPFARRVKFSPLGERVWSLYSGLPCAPCDQDKPLACGGSYRCVRSLTPEIAYEAARLILEETGAA